jgi:hypothetical protein
MKLEDLTVYKIKLTELQSTELRERFYGMIIGDTHTEDMLEEYGLTVADAQKIYDALPDNKAGVFILNPQYFELVTDVVQNLMDQYEDPLDAYESGIYKSMRNLLRKLNKINYT